jgi:hypothetical protein
LRSNPKQTLISDKIDWMMDVSTSSLSGRILCGMGGSVSPETKTFFLGFRKLAGR